MSVFPTFAELFSLAVILDCINLLRCDLQQNVQQSKSLKLKLGIARPTSFHNFLNGSPCSEKLQISMTKTSFFCLNYYKKLKNVFIVG